MMSIDPKTIRLREPVSISPGKGNQNSLHICWMLHNACNHRCSYCSSWNYSGDARWLKMDRVKAFWRQVRETYRRDHFHISFTGGEPTLWPGFSELCRMLKADGCDLGLTSNGSHDMKAWSETQDCFNWLCLSYHPEFTKDDHFLKVIELMAARTRVAVRLMMHKQEKLWQRSVEFGEKLRNLPADAPLFVEYVPLQEDFGHESRPVKYEAWQEDFFASNPHFSHGGKSETINKHLSMSRDVWDYQVEYSDGTAAFCRPNELVAGKQVNFKNWSCFAGVDMLFVNAQGEIYRGGCKIGGKIGHIFDEKIAFPVEPILCPKNFCPCGTDIQVKKHSTPAAEMGAR